MDQNEIVLHARATRTVEVLLPFVKQQNEIAAPFVALPDFLYFLQRRPSHSSCHNLRQNC